MLNYKRKWHYLCRQYYIAHQNINKNYRYIFINFFIYLLCLLLILLYVMDRIYFIVCFENFTKAYVMLVVNEEDMQLAKCSPNKSFFWKPKGKPLMFCFEFYKV